MSATTSFKLPEGTVLKGEKYRYKIIKYLGQGAFGITYQAEVVLEAALGVLKSDAKVAVKEFFLKDINERKVTELSIGNSSAMFIDYRNKFRKEAINLSKMKCSGIVKVLESFDANNTTYIIMEYLDGGTLNNLIKAEGKLSHSKALAYIKEICCSLNYMHGQKTLHLDLKPSNIMFDKDGTVKLIDFGLAKHYNEDGIPDSTTTIGLGTPGYAPIEQSLYQGNGTFEPTLDIYALGATYFKMLTGNNPPPAPLVLKESRILRNQLEDAGVPSPVISFIVKAMAPVSDNRYQTVNEFLTALQAIENSSKDDEYTKPVHPEEKKPDQVEDEETITGQGIQDDEGQNVSENADEKEPDSDNNNVSGDDSDEDSGDEPKPDIRRILLKYSKYVGALAVLITVITWWWSDKNNGSDDTPDGTITIIQDTISTVVVPDESTPKEVVENHIPGHFVLIPAGTLKKFKMEDFENKYQDFKLDSFYISKYEVTQIEYETIMGKNSSEHKGDSLPISGMTYTDVINFCNALSHKHGYDGFYTIENDEISINHNGNGFRLPTLYEWVYAARGGVNKKMKYAAAETIKDIAWYAVNSKNKPHPVGQKKSNGYCLYDMNGNVSELLWKSREWECNLQIGGNYDYWIKLQEDDEESCYNSFFTGFRLVLITKGMTNKNTIGYDQSKDYIDEINSRYEAAYEPKEGLQGVRKNGKYGYIDKTGKEVIPLIYDEARGFSSGRAVIKLNDKEGLIDTKGNLVVNNVYDYCSSVYEDMIVVGINGKKNALDRKYGYVDKNGNVIVEPTYSVAFDFSEGLAAVMINEKYGFIDKTGKLVIEAKYNNVGIYGFKEGLARVSLDGYYGYINKSGETVIPFTYDYAYDFKKGKAEVSKDGRTFYIDKTGKEI